MSLSRRYRDIVSVIDIEIGQVRSIAALEEAVTLLRKVSDYCDKKATSLNVIRTVLCAEALEHPKK
jgi:hypothetical protein